MPTSPSGPVPNFPKQTKIPAFKVTKKALPDIEIPSSLSFHYAGISSLWLWYLAPVELLRAYLEPLGMSPYIFGKHGAVNINFFNAVAFYGQGQPGNQGLGGFNETEINIAAYATKVADLVPQGLSLPEFLLNGDQTKRIGNYRVWVACDDPVAVACGVQVFMENKFLVQYTYNIPGPNNRRNPPDEARYDWTLHDNTKQASVIYQASVNLVKLAPTLGNPTEIIDLSFDRTTRRPVGSRRNYLGLFNTYLGPGVKQAVKLSYGKSRHPMRHDMKRLIGSSRPVALQLYRSPICIAEAAGYFADL